MVIKLPKLIVKPINIKLDGLENLLERRMAPSLHLDKKTIKKRFNRYGGTFLLVGDNFFRIPNISFLNYTNINFDVDDFGVFPAVVYNNFNGGNLHGHFSDGSIIDFERKGYVGKMDVGRYFKQEAFNQYFDENIKKTKEQIKNRS